MMCKKWPTNIMLFVHLVRKSDNFTSSCLVLGILTDNALQNVKTPISNLKHPCYGAAICEDHSPPRDAVVTSIFIQICHVV